MLVDSVKSLSDGTSVSLIGRVMRFENEYVVVECNGKETKIKHNGLDEYQKKNILVEGTVEGEKIIQENVYNVEEEFDYGDIELYLKVAKVVPSIY